MAKHVGFCVEEYRSYLQSLYKTLQPIYCNGSRLPSLLETWKSYEKTYRPKQNKHKSVDFNGCWLCDMAFRHVTPLKFVRAVIIFRQPRGLWGVAAALRYNQTPFYCKVISIIDVVLIFFRRRRFALWKARVDWCCGADTARGREHQNSLECRPEGFLDLTRLMVWDQGDACCISNVEVLPYHF